MTSIFVQVDNKTVIQLLLFQKYMSMVTVETKSKSYLSYVENNVSLLLLIPVKHNLMHFICASIGSVPVSLPVHL